MFFLGTALPVMAQDEVQDEVAVAPIKVDKPTKTYPTIEIKGKVLDILPWQMRMVNTRFRYQSL